MNTVKLGTVQYGLLIEALRRYTMPGSTASTKELTEALTGLGSYTRYRSVVPRFMVRICWTGHTPDVTNWWKLTEDGAQIVSEWIRQGYHYGQFEHYRFNSWASIIGPSSVFNFDRPTAIIRADLKSHLYILHGGCCLGFDVCAKWSENLIDEMDIGTLYPVHVGTEAAYIQYQRLVKYARERNLESGWQSCSQLTPELIGLEGWRIEIVTSWGEKERFIVGKSTGFFPCHLALARRDSSGGPAVIGSPFKSIRKLYKVR